MRSGQAILCVGVLSTLVSVTTAAHANFVDDFLLGYGFCSADGPHYRDGSAFEIDPTAPFGKPASEWTDGDLVHLHDAFATCHSLTLQSGRRHEPMNYQGLEATIPKIVAQARFEVRQQAQDRAATERNKSFATQQRENAERRAAEIAHADEGSAERDRDAAKIESDAAIARDQAVIAAAHARRDAALARQKAAAVHAEAEASEREAKLAENHPAPAPLPTYREIDLIDLQAEGAKLRSARVSVEGFGWFAVEVLNLGADANGRIAINVNVDALAKEVKKRLITQCQDPFDRTGCRIVVRGRVDAGPSASPGDLKADSISF